MIQHYKKNHKKALISLLNGYPMNWGDHALVTLVSLEGDKITGVGSLSKNQLHPNREYINIYIHPKERQQDIGELIFKDLLSLSKTKKFQVAISSKNTAAVSFLEKGGFLLARKCYTPQLINTWHDLPADAIRAIYRSRWEIELFFKHINQHLTIKTYFSRSEQGVTNQLILAMIAYLLTFLLQQKTKTRWSHFQVLRRLRAVIFEPYERLLALLIPT